MILDRGVSMKKNMFILLTVLFLFGSSNMLVVGALDDSVEFYHSDAYDNRIDAGTEGVAMFKARWLNNGSDIVDNMTLIIKSSGTFGEEYLLAEFVDGWWQVTGNYTEAGFMTYSVFLVECNGTGEFQQNCDNVAIVWDEITTTTNTTTSTTSTTTTTTTTTTTIVEDENDGLYIMIGVGMFAVIIVIMVISLKRR